MRILVTGAGGFVGHHVVAELLAGGHEVIAATISPDHAVGAGVAAQEVFDICDAPAVKAALDRVQPDGIVHLAAQASPRRSWEAVDETYAVNVTGASHLFQALVERPATRVLLVGSAQEYGQADLDRPLRETDRLQPRSPYGVSKVAQELVGQMYRQEFGMPVVMARPFNHTGPGQSSEYVVGAFSRQIAEIECGTREPRLSVGWLSSQRDFLDVRDVARAYRLLIEAGTPGEVYNVASGTPQRIGRLLDILLEAAGLAGSVEVVSAAQPRADEPDVLLGDASKLREGLGWAPEIAIEQSLAETLESYRTALAGKGGDT